MLAKDCMNKNVIMITEDKSEDLSLASLVSFLSPLYSCSLFSPSTACMEAAKLLLDNDIGYLPVVKDGKIIGALTDRDIAVRLVAKGKGTETLVRDIYTKDVKYVYEDVTLEEVARNLGDLKFRRLPVVSRTKALVGVIGLGSISWHCPDLAGLALKKVTGHGVSHAGK